MRDQIANIWWIIEKTREFHKNICFIDFAKPFDCVVHDRLENSKRRVHQTPLTDTWETCMQVRKQQLEPDMEQQTGSKLAKENAKASYCHLLI